MEVKQINDICLKVCSGGTPKSSVASYYNGDIPWLNTNEVNFCNIYSTAKHISEEGLKKSAAKYIPENTVIVAMYGVTAGKCAITKIPLTTNQACCNLIIDETKAHYQYVYYFLKLQSDFLNSLATGGAQQNLNALMIKRFPIILPSLSVQYKIASILSDYDTLIDINTKRIKILEETARELYKEWFVRMRFPGHEKTKFVKGIPEGWKYSSLQDFGRIETGKTPSMEKPEYYGGDYLFIKTPDMHDSMFVFDTAETLSEAGNNCQKKKLLPVNSIMVSCIGSTGVGTVAINAKQGHTNQQINSIILHNQEWLTWLYFTCESLKPTIEMYGATGSTMTNLSKGKFETLKVIEPTADIIQKFNELESPLFEDIKNLQLQNQELTATRDRLLPRLLSGELKVGA